MINYRNELTKQLAEINQLLKEADNRLKKSKNLEEGKLRVCSSHGYPQYHFRPAGDEKERYIPASEKDKIKALVQKEYDQKIKRELELSSKKLQKFLASYDVNNIAAIYEKLHVGRKSLIDPIIPTKEMIIKKWYEEHPGDKNPFQKDAIVTTKRGELVRSKSEKILADMFYDYNIPYQYEPCLEIHTDEARYAGDYGTKYYKKIYPDFALLDVKREKTIYWEHLGLIDDDNYATKNFSKLIEYEKHGLILGDNLIITMETREKPLDVRLVKIKIKDFLE
ncbi:MAG: hypothetical protein K5792_12110 [Butyrivibrio sp.]|nr:hypothetical protein [Butyrivibrio sp.]